MKVRDRKSVIVVFNRLSKSALFSLLVVLVLIFSGCAPVDSTYSPKPSFTLPAQPQSRLAQVVAPLLLNRPAHESGFHVISDGVDALAVRLLLSAQADSSIDLQYYLIKNDLTGRVFVAALLAAADRNVRVRILIDDMFTGGHDKTLVALDAHPNIEIRVFNPFRRGFLGRASSALTDFQRINRRMHNKSFTVDNQVTVIGGRNIADEYFGARSDASFSDLDVVAVGPVVSEVSTMFDRYWNHVAASPIPMFIRIPENTTNALVQLRKSLSNWKRDMEASPYAGVLRRNELVAIEEKPADLTWARYTLVYDSPDKGIPSRAADVQSITALLGDAFRGAKEKVLIISPYFVPMRTGEQALAGLAERGVEVTVITNSLAANNQFAVHAGYAPARKSLLKLGINIHEARSDAKVDGAELVSASGAKSTLHTKAFIIDSEQVFIGSFNFDPRSANLNTEAGVIIHSQTLASEMLSKVDDALPEQTYRLYLNSAGRLRWSERNDTVEQIWTHEPETAWWKRAAVQFLRLLPIGSQL